MTEQELIALAITNLGENPEDVRTVKDACLAFYGHGAFDEQSGDMETSFGHFFRVDRWIVVTDTQGFTYLNAFATESDAIESFAQAERSYEETCSE